LRYNAVKQHYVGLFQVEWAQPRQHYNINLIF
jgi:hypothetical protein